MTAALLCRGFVECVKGTGSHPVAPWRSSEVIQEPWPLKQNTQIGATGRLTKTIPSVRGRHGGVENLTNDTPPKKGFWTPPRTVRFPAPSGVSALFFLYKNPRQSRPEALWRGPKTFGRARSLVRFPPPIRFAPPHIAAQLW